MHTLSVWVIGFVSFMARVKAGAEVITFPSACIYGKTTFMKKSITVKPKRGRPPSGGRDPFVGIRLPASLLEQIGTWSEKHAAATRSEAIRRLVELGLKVKMPARPVSKPGRRLRAQELATNAIEKIIDPAAPPEERAQRRQPLTKGPSEFFEDRVDLPKARK
jgi:hypothetical protein